MINRIKTLVAVTALGLATIGIYSSDSNAAPTTNPNTIKPTAMQAVAPPAKVPPRPIHCLTSTPPHQSAWHLGLHHHKKLTESDARVITKAALLMQGHQRLDVGKIAEKQTPRGRTIYLIDIVNHNHKVVRRVALNSANGRIHPLQPAPMARPI